MTPEELDRQLHAFMHHYHFFMWRYFQQHGLFNGQPPMLFLIRAFPEITQKELAKKMKITPASVAASVKRMEAEGLVLRTADDKDARILHLQLTDKGAALDRKCQAARDRIVDALFSPLTPEEIDWQASMIARLEARLLELESNDNGKEAHT